MGLLNELGVNPTEVSITDIEKKMASGDLPPPGVHHAVLTSVGGIPNADGRGWKLTFEIIAGPGKGATVEEALWKPKGENEKKDATTRNRVLLFGCRLGLFKKVTKDGKESIEEVQGKHDFCDCLGATCFIEVEHGEREYTDERSKTVKKIKEAKMTFGGLLAPDDKKVKGVAVAASGAGAAAAKAAASQQKPKDTYTDL